MKLFNLVAASLVLATIPAHANIPAIAPGSRAENVAGLASDVFEVKEGKIGTKKYKIVSMDSELNGDLSTTTILLVGEKEVGGAAGYDAAFQLTPAPEAESMSAVRFLKNGVEISLRSFEGKITKKLLRFDPKSKSLIEKIVR